MANIKSNIKTKKQSDKRHLFNKAKISALKTSIKKAKESKNEKDLAIVYANADSLSRKGIIHKNRANRIKARITNFINKNKKNKSDQKLDKNVVKEINANESTNDNTLIQTNKDKNSNAIKKE